MPILSKNFIVNNFYCNIYFYIINLFCFSLCKCVYNNILLNFFKNYSTKSNIFSNYAILSKNTTFNYILVNKSLNKSSSSSSISF